MFVVFYIVKTLYILCVYEFLQIILFVTHLWIHGMREREGERESNTNISYYKTNHCIKFMPKIETFSNTFQFTL